MSYNYFKAYLSVSATPSVGYRHDLQQRVNSDFENASTYYVIKSQNRVTELWSDMGVRLTKPYKMKLMRTLEDDYYQAIFKDGTYAANLGDMFEFNDYRYMVVDVNRVQTPTSSCIIQRCNIQLKFVASNALVVSATPVDYYTIDGIGVTSMSMPKEDYIVNLTDSEMICTIPSSSAAKLIKYSSGGTRFLLGDPLESWTCVAIDSVTSVRRTLGDFVSDSNGVVKLKLSNKISGINKSLDDLVLGIAQQKCYGGS